MTKPTVIKANATRQVVNGLEQGRSGYGFRAVAPLFLDGQQLGSVSFGFDMGEAFLNMLNEDFKGNWGVYNLARGVKSIDDRFLIDSVGADKTKYFHNSLPDDQILQKIRDGNYYYEKEESTQTVSLYLPVRNFQGDVVVLVRYVYPTRYFGKIAYIKKSSGLICLFGLVACSLILYFLFSMITGPVHKLIVETGKIKAMELDGPMAIASPLVEMRERVQVGSADVVRRTLAVAGAQVGLASRLGLPDRHAQIAVVGGELGQRRGQPLIGHGRRPPPRPAPQIAGRVPTPTQALPQGWGRVQEGLRKPLENRHGAFRHRPPRRR